MIDEGTVAPDFELAADDGSAVRLSNDSRKRICSRHPTVRALTV